MRDLERELRALPVAWPETPDLAAAVRPRLAPHAARRPGRRRARIAAAVVALLLGGVAAVEPARSAVLELLGLKSVRIERREPVATPQPPGAADLGLGRRVTQAQAERGAAGFRPRPPAALGPATAIFLSESGHVTYAYGAEPDVLVTELRAGVTPVIGKAVGPDARLDRFRIDGDPAYFISGAPHGVAFAEPGGNLQLDQQRLAGNTLLVERGALLVRVEGDLSRARATAIARSIPR